MFGAAIKRYVSSSPCHILACIVQPGAAMQMLYSTNTLVLLECGMKLLDQHPTSILQEKVGRNLAASYTVKIEARAQWLRKLLQQAAKYK